MRACFFQLIHWCLNVPSVSVWLVFSLSEILEQKASSNLCSKSVGKIEKKMKQSIYMLKNHFEWAFNWMLYELGFFLVQFVLEIIFNLIKPCIDWQPTLELLHSSLASRYFSPSLSLVNHFQQVSLDTRGSDCCTSFTKQVW